jgi:cyclic dehypoxanthinyl futalosine synthase
VNLEINSNLDSKNNLLCTYNNGVFTTHFWKPAPTLQEINDRIFQKQIQESHFFEMRQTLIEKKISDVSSVELKNIYQKCFERKRISAEEGLMLLNSGELNLLGLLATNAKEYFHKPNEATFLVDRNINYTNICRIGCDFCAFYRREGDKEAYVIPNEEIHKKIEETIAQGGTGVLMQGGVNPKLKVEYYEELFSGIKRKYKIHLHALSVIEIEGIAQVSRLTVTETLKRLKAAGLDSIPGAGAEILVDEVRLNQSPVKRHAKRWLDVMKLAHAENLPTTATMMFGALEENKHIIEHICNIRSVQDETKGFYSFILWTFQGENTDLLKKNPTLQTTTAVEYLKVLAISRLMMDNIPNLQGSWVTMGPKIGQISLHYGANDMGSIMIEENVVSAAGTSHQLNRNSMIELVAAAGFIPVQRDTYYREMERF